MIFDPNESCTDQIQFFIGEIVTYDGGQYYYDPALFQVVSIKNEETAIILEPNASSTSEIADVELCTIYVSGKVKNVSKKRLKKV